MFKPHDDNLKATQASQTIWSEELFVLLLLLLFNLTRMVSLFITANRPINAPLEWAEMGADKLSQAAREPMELIVIYKN